MIDAPDTNSNGTDFSKQPIAKIIAWSLHNQIIVLVLATALGHCRLAFRSEHTARRNSGI